MSDANRLRKAIVLYQTWDSERIETTVEVHITHAGYLKVPPPPHAWQCTALTIWRANLHALSGLGLVESRS